MNILLTNHCNRKCTYCFAQERIKFGGDADAPEVPPYISLEDYSKALEFTRKSRRFQVGILGGEPSLHPDFLKLLYRAWSTGINTKIFTNGLWKSESVEELRDQPRSVSKNFQIILNINEPSRTPPKQKKRQEALLEGLGRCCSLSFNISHIGFEPRFLVDIIKEFRTRRNIRLGLAQPLAQISNENVDISDYREIVPQIMELNRLCDENDIRLGFDCGFTLCMFGPAEIGEFVLSGTRFRAKCGPAVDIGTDLSVWACFPLSKFTKGVYLSEFASLGELDRYFNQHFRRLYRTGALDECIGCRHRKRGQCSGGCAAHVYRRMAS